MAKKKAKKLRFFYLNGNLHRSLHINRSSDQIVTWCYPLRKRIVYTYSDVKKNKRPAFTTTEVGQMLNRAHFTMKMALIKGNLERPQHAYPLTGDPTRIKFFWSEEDVLAAHDFFSQVHFGRPRSDGLVNPKNLPTRREVLAMMRQEDILYVKNEDGEFVPVWNAPDFS